MLSLTLSVIPGRFRVGFLLHMGGPQRRSCLTKIKHVCEVFARAKAAVVFVHLPEVLAYRQGVRR